MFLQYFSSTSNCVNVLSESDDLLIRGVVNLYFNELYMHANAEQKPFRYVNLDFVHVNFNNCIMSCLHVTV